MFQKTSAVPLKTRVAQYLAISLLLQPNPRRQYDAAKQGITEEMKPRNTNVNENKTLHPFK
jgi:hypothetical protein